MPTGPANLGGLAADQGAAGLAAACGDARHDRRGDLGVELAGGEIVEKKQRLGAPGDNVIDAHGDEVDADTAVMRRGESDLEFGADPIGARDQNRIAVAGGSQVEEAAIAADLGLGAGPRGGADQWPDGFD